MSAPTSFFLGNVGEAVAYMENWPLTVVQSSPNSEAEFMRDIVMMWKASERGAAAVIEPRLLLESRV
jgi:hypothetical protein